MAKIPLRAYNREIENLIDQGKSLEAIAHCRQVLKYYPKHLDTYRLLGKAFLELQRYGEAADILQRVLSSVPDDFISQIGMSIIREDEGNLDGAIWHMEHAHEIQPSNPAIQDELRRLYGRRDGVEPPKIRLTRGALVRMYARGDLYPQAIAEIRAALAENPQRPDLEVILARMYYASGQKVEAAEVASRLVNKLPYCFEANRILADVLPGTSRADDAQVVQQRVYALDPYLEFLAPGSTNPVDVPDNAVLVEHLDYEAAAEQAESPDWTQNLGVNLEEPEEESPSWMSAQTHEEAPAWNQPSAQEAEPAEEIEPAEIPDWMASAGWKPFEGEETPPESILADEGADEDIQPAEIPDWLRSIAPAEEDTSPQDEADAEKWLQGLVGTEEPVASTSFTQDTAVTPPADDDWLASLTAQTEAEPVIGEEAPEQPAWLSEAGLEEGSVDWLKADETPVGEAPITSETIENTAQEAELPAWLSSLTETAGEEEQISTPAAEEELPDWLKGITEPGPVEQAETPAVEEQLPEWLSSESEEKTQANLEWLESETELAESPEELEESQFEPADEAADLPAWLRDLAATPEEELTSSETQEFNTLPEMEKQTLEMDDSTPQDLDSAMAWLESLAAKQGADEATLVTRPEDRQDTPPEWVQNAVDTEGTPAEVVAEEESETLDELLQLEEMLEGPADLEESSKAAVASEPSIISELEETAEILTVEETVETSTAVPEGGEELQVDDDTFAWLESLAAKQGADEETLLTASEERSEEMPEWLSSVAADQPETASSLEEEDTQETETTSEAMPEWLTDAVSEETETVDALGEESAPEAEPISEEDLPAWLTSALADEEAPEPMETAAEPEISAAVGEWISEGEETEAVEPTQPVHIHEEPAAEESIEAAQEDLQQPEAAEIEADTSTISYKPEPAELEPSVQEEEVPEWLKALEQESLQPEEPLSFTPQEPDLAPASMDNSGSEVSHALKAAQTQLNQGRIDPALEIYNQLIQSGQNLEETIHDLRDALYRYPVDISIWQSLGDAYARNNMLQDALDAYTKAEELLR